MVCYEGKEENIKLEVWNKKLKKGLEKNGLRFIWFSSCGRNKKEICSFGQSKMHGYAKPRQPWQHLLVGYCEIHSGGSREEYVGHCNKSERSGLAWFRTGFWKSWQWKNTTGKRKCQRIAQQRASIRAVEHVCHLTAVRGIVSATLCRTRSLTLDLRWQTNSIGTVDCYINCSAVSAIISGCYTNSTVNVMALLTMFFVSEAFRS